MVCLYRPDNRQTGIMELCCMEIPFKYRKGQYVSSGMFLISGPKNRLLVMDMWNTLVVICNAQNLSLFLQTQHHPAVKNIT